MLMPTLQQEQLALVMHKERLERAERVYRHLSIHPERTPHGPTWLQRLLQQVRRRAAAHPTMTVEQIGTASRQQTV